MGHFLYSRLSPLAFLVLGGLLSEPLGLTAQEPSKEKTGIIEITPAEVQKKAEAGDVEAQILLANLILSGRMEKQGPKEALAWLQKASDSGDAKGKFALAQLLLSGQPGVPVDQEQGKFLLQEAAEAGLPAAQSAYGAILESAIDPKARELDYSEPLKWYNKALEKDDPEALYRLGVKQLNGEHLPKDEAAGVKKLQKAAQTGHSTALNEIGFCYFQGKGLPADIHAALGYFLSAAEQGNASAMINLGTAYERGQGVPQNFSTAGAYYAKAAKQNSGLGQYMLGRLYENGLGTDKSPEKAWMNYVRAAKNGIKGAKEAKDKIRSKLTEAAVKKLENDFPDLKSKSTD